MTEVVEKVKAAILAADVPHSDSTHPTRSLGYYLGVGIDAFSHDYARFDRLAELAARAAIEAMRPRELGDLPEAMAMAGEGAIDSVGHGSYAAAHEVFAAMIDAALSSGEQDG